MRSASSGVAGLGRGDEPGLVAEDRVGHACHLGELGTVEAAPGLGELLAGPELRRLGADGLDRPVPGRAGEDREEQLGLLGGDPAVRHELLEDDVGLLRARGVGLEEGALRGDRRLVLEPVALQQRGRERDGDLELGVEVFVVAERVEQAEHLGHVERGGAEVAHRVEVLAVVDGVDGLHEARVDLLPHGVVAAVLLAVVLPQQTEGGVEDPVVAGTRAQLVVVEAPGLDVVDAADVEHDVGRRQDLGVAGADHLGVREELGEEGDAEDVVCVELAVVGCDDHTRQPTGRG